MTTNIYQSENFISSAKPVCEHIFQETEFQYFPEKFGKEYLIPIMGKICLKCNDVEFSEEALAKFIDDFNRAGYRFEIKHKSSGFYAVCKKLKNFLAFGKTLTALDLNISEKIIDWHCKYKDEV